MTKAPIVKVMVFLVVTYGQESWTIKKAGTKAEAPILWPPAAYSWLIQKDPDAGKEWAQEEKDVTEEEWLNGIPDSVDMGLGKLWDTVKFREAWHLQFKGLKESDMI